MKRTKGQKNKKLIVGANDTLAVYKQLVRIPPTIGFRGCFRRSPAVIWQQLINFSFGYLSVDFCISHCERNGYMLAGIQSPSSCGCENISPSLHLHDGVDPAHCMLVCVDKQSCGGPGYVSVYRTKSLRHICSSSESTPQDAISQNVKESPAYLLGVKGSGTSWISTLIRSSIGLDDRTKESITLFNHQILQATHELDSMVLVDPKTKVVVLLRNPYATFLSMFRRKIEAENNMDTHHTYLDSKILGDYGWEMFVSEIMRSWDVQYKFWISNVKRENSMIIYYEDFLVNPVGQISRMLRFLQVKFNSQRLLCTLENYVRKYNPDVSTFLPYSRNDTARIQNLVDSVSLEITRRNFMPMPLYTFENRTSRLEQSKNPKHKAYYNGQKKDL
ncbi:sialate:O-sulfotransferase 1-like [Symsagittifera roscoffensis]|uniref:sialate:O-sulfotransferase 1-like n=1 Tax=Symsagittifera roscoffensis TaxID=84072 RepID=UPI00307BCAE8